MYNLFKFQKDAIEKLLNVFVNIHKIDKQQMPIVFKAPTGSGKTIMLANFICGLNHLPQWQNDKAFIWITFSDDLAMQSRGKFIEYFENDLENDLLTVNDINNGKLKKNDVIFLNWQKIVAKNAETRNLRRPIDENECKEFGKYWEDIIDATHEEKREIILIIDESHKNKGTKLAQDIIDYINPRVVIHVSATPDDVDILSAVEMDSYIKIDRQEVVDAGLIKEKIAIQTEEDLLKYSSEDLDSVLLQLGLQKREQIKNELDRINKAINPLMLIQLPNDDNKLIEMSQEKKEDVVCKFLQAHGVKDHQIAKWFDGRQINMEDIRDNDSEVDFMLFKQAAGTGWDCPRACVLVMFREIQSNKFYVQTIGRILRMPDPKHKENFENNSLLKTGFLFTNYKRNIIEIPDQSTNNKPNIYSAQIKQEITNITLSSDDLPRIDYGDFSKSSKFQLSFINSMNKYFGINGKDMLGESQKKLKKFGIDLSGKVANKIIVDAEFEDFDQINYDFHKQGKDLEYELSSNDVDKTFNYMCYKLLVEQDDEASHYGNIARSWSRLKSAIRVWLSTILNSDCDYYYRVFINDILKGASSKFRPAVTKALADFKPIVAQLLKEKEEALSKKIKPIFTIQPEYLYTEDYEEISQKLCVLNKFFMLKNKEGEGNEIEFMKYIDEKKDFVKWWFKNGDHGKDYFAIKYFNTSKKTESLFYPDWIIQFTNGKIGIFDTKSGRTAVDTEGRAGALSEKLKELGKQYIGGIVVFENGVWYHNSSEKYEYIPGHIGDNKNWKLFEELLRN